MLTLTEYLILMLVTIVLFAGIFQLCIITSDFYHKRIRSLLLKVKPPQVAKPKA